jgi:phenylacetaldehyde dehydrogenase
MLIDGAWVEAASGKTFPAYDLSTEEIIAHVAEGKEEDIHRAVRAARQAFDQSPWRKVTPSERGRMLWRLGDLHESHAEEFAQLESLDNGKPLKIARIADVPRE